MTHVIGKARSLFFITPMGTQNKIGKVWLVGAGPGDPDLLTIKADRILRQADVVFYDALANPEILDLLPQACEKIYVGKEEGHHAVEQEGINQLLIDTARLGLRVVRLKGGDPFVFGRGGEEALDLFRAGISFEIVPGISSSIAAAAYAGIPVTHRNIATSFAVITGHQCDESATQIDYREYAGIDTLVFLMGVRHRHLIAKALVTGGRSPQTPVAFIERGTTPQQKRIVSDLQSVAQRLVQVQPPAVMIVGEVVRLHAELDWFHPDQNTNAKRRNVLDDLQKNFPLVEEPFREIAVRHGLKTQDILETLEQGKENGQISRLGVVIPPRKIGYSELVALKVESEKIAEMAGFVNSFLEVNHNYERESEWNMWFVVTALTTDQVDEVVRQIEIKNGSEALRLPLEREFHIDLGFSLKDTPNPLGDRC